MENDDNIQIRFDSLWSSQEDMILNRMHTLVNENRIEDCDSIFCEYHVDGVDPDEVEYFYAPRLRKYSYSWIILNI